MQMMTHGVVADIWDAVGDARQASGNEEGAERAWATAESVRLGVHPSDGLSAHLDAHRDLRRSRAQEAFLNR